MNAAIDYISMMDACHTDYSGDTITVSEWDDSFILELPATSDGVEHHVTVSDADMRRMIRSAEVYADENAAGWSTWDIAEDLTGNTLYNPSMLTVGNMRLVTPEDYEPSVEYVSSFVRRNLDMLEPLRDHAGRYHVNYYSANSNSIDSYTVNLCDSAVNLDEHADEWAVTLNNADIEALKRATMKYGIGSIVNQ